MNRKRFFLPVAAIGAVIFVSFCGAAQPRDCYHCSEYDGAGLVQHQLNDAVPQPLRPTHPVTVTPIASMSMSNVVLHTLQTNPQLLGARAHWCASVSALHQAQGTQLPTVDLHLARGYERSNTPTLLAAGLSDIDLFRQENDIAVQQNLFTGGSRRNSIRQERGLSESAQFDTVAKNEAVALAAATTYLNVLRESRLVFLNQFNINNHQMVLNKVRQREHSGVTHRANVELASSRLILAKTLLTQEQKKQKNAHNDFVAVTGEHPAGLAFKLLSPYLPRVGLAQLQGFAFHHNPIILAAKAAFMASRAAIRVAKANFYPSLSLDLNAGYNRDIDGINGKNNEAAAMAVLNYNLYRGGQDIARTRQAAQESVASDDQMSSQYRAVQLQIRNSFHNLKADAIRIRQLRAYVAMSRRLVASYNKQFEVGKQTLFNVLDAYNQLYNARVALTNARFDDTIEYYQLLEAQGQLIRTLLGHDHHYIRT